MNTKSLFVWVPNRISRMLYNHCACMWFIFSLAEKKEQFQATFSRLTYLSFRCCRKSNRITWTYWRGYFLVYWTNNSFICNFYFMCWSHSGRIENACTSEDFETLKGSGICGKFPWFGLNCEFLIRYVRL